MSVSILPLILAGCPRDGKALPVADEPTMLQRLMATIEGRKAATQEKSYTASLLAGGVAKIGRKITEEAAEVVEAAAEPGADGQSHLVREAADLLYHLLVMLACRDVSLADVEAELARREGVSGHEEKAARGQGQP
jgi:phosphoribosyl-ATP pyrophosphohydrolase